MNRGRGPAGLVAGANPGTRPGLGGAHWEPLTASLLCLFPNCLKIQIHCHSAWLGRGRKAQKGGAPHILPDTLPGNALWPENFSVFGSSSIRGLPAAGPGAAERPESSGRPRDQKTGDPREALFGWEAPGILCASPEARHGGWPAVGILQAQWMRAGVREPGGLQMVSTRPTLHPK